MSKAPEQAKSILWIEVVREWFGAERYARDYEYLDANYGKQAKQVADFLNRRLAAPQPPASGDEVERARIVAWLHAYAECCRAEEQPEGALCVDFAADAIERGEHLT